MNKLIKRIESLKGLDKLTFILMGVGLPTTGIITLAYNLINTNFEEVQFGEHVFVVLMYVLAIIFCIFCLLAVFKELLSLRTCKYLLNHGVLIKGLKYKIERVKKDYKRPYSYNIKATYVANDGKEYILKQVNTNPISVYSLYNTIDAVIDPHNPRKFYLNVAMEKDELISEVNLDFTKGIFYSGIIDENYEHSVLNNKFRENLQIKSLDELTLYSKTFSTIDINKEYWRIDDYINNPIFIKWPEIDYTINYFMKIEKQIYFGSLAPFEYRRNETTPTYLIDKYILKFNFNHSINMSCIIEGLEKKSDLFSECYSVFSNEEEKVREILNDTVIEKLIIIRHKIKGEVDFCINKDVAYVILQGIPTLTELKSRKRPQKYEDNMCSTFDGILDCIDILKEIEKNN